MEWEEKSRNIVNRFFESKKNSNSLLELESLLLLADENAVLAAMDAVFALFSRIFSEGMLDVKSSLGKDQEYQQWLFERYEDFINHFIDYLSHENKDIQVSALNLTLSFLQLEAQNPCRDGSMNRMFPFTLFHKLISNLLSEETDMSEQIQVFKDYMCYVDIMFYLLKSICVSLKGKTEVPNLCLQNCILLLNSIKFPQDFSTLYYTTSANKELQIKEKPFRKLFSSAWGTLLNLKLPVDQLKKVLPILNENILSHLQNPCFLTDFLVNAYSSGGILSLLALKGLFTLMNQYNLDYPDFYTKLYALLDPMIINGQFGNHFFNLSRLFLSSSHLPSHIVAAFVKKFSRMSLVCSSANVVKIQSLVTNLLVNHPSLQSLLNKDSNLEYEKDSFDERVMDAGENSLWEMKTLESHINPDVCSNARRLMEVFPKFGMNLPKVSMNGLYQKERKRKLEDVPLAIQKPVLKKTRLCTFS